jgi:hypothetical protein
MTGEGGKGLVTLVIQKKFTAYYVRRLTTFFGGRGQSPRIPKNRIAARAASAIGHISRTLCS